MANKRMIIKSVCCSDVFLSMSAGAQALFYQLQLEADDYGFVANPVRIARGCMRQPDEIEELILNGFCLQFPSGHIVMRHWFAANRLEKKCNPLDEAEYALLEQDMNGVFTLTSGNFPGRTGQHKEGQDKGMKQNPGQRRPRTIDEVVAEAKELGLSAEAAREFYCEQEKCGWVDNKGNPLTSWSAWLKSWTELKGRRVKTQAGLQYDQRPYSAGELEEIKERQDEVLRQYGDAAAGGEGP